MTPRDKPAVITVRMDKRCHRCGKLGATGESGTGPCLKCLVKAVTSGKLDHIIRRPEPKATHPKEQR